MMYLIQNSKTGKYSKGGCPCPQWTDKMGDAKVWKKASFVKSHLTSMRKYRTRWGVNHRAREDALWRDENDIADWIVLEVELMPRNTYAAEHFSVSPCSVKPFDSCVLPR